MFYLNAYYENEKQVIVNETDSIDELKSWIMEHLNQKADRINIVREDEQMSKERFILSKLKACRHYLRALKELKIEIPEV